MRYVCFFLTALFAAFAALQLNDPDPVLWTGLYLVPAGVALGAALGRLPAALAYGLAGIYAALAAWWWPARFDGVTGPMSPATTVEESREALGLVIAAAGLAVSGYAARRVTPRR